MTRHLTVTRVAALLMVAAWVGAQPDDDHDHDHESEPVGAHVSAEDEPHVEDEADDPDGEHGHVSLTPDEIEEFGIEVAVAGPGSIERFLSLPGEVQPNADRLAHIVPRYSGIVTEVRVHIGDRVREGDVLAVIESDESLAPFEVKTLLSGTVIEKHIALGEAVSRDRDTFVIADLSTVWIDLTLYQRDLDRVLVGQRAAIYVGHAMAERNGRISYITPVVDERTRTATARIVLSNSDGRWRPGMFVTGRVLVESIDVPVAVPRSALHLLEGETVIFIQEDEGFAAVDVETGRVSETHVEILSGIEAGTPYVSHGGFTLKAELGKESFGHGGHAH